MKLDKKPETDRPAS
jgi:hypothetical protein